MFLKRLLFKDRPCHSSFSGAGSQPSKTEGRGAVQLSFMKTARCVALVSAFAAIILFNSSCSPKYGCPSNGKNVGAERILSGEKVPKAGKFKS